MNEHDQLLWDVLCDPSDDAARSLYADWLSDHGEYRRADAIHYGLYVARANKGDHSNPVSEHYWNDDMNPDLWPKGCVTARDRGFIFSVECNMSAWRKYAPEWVKKHPITCVKINGRFPQGNTWMRSNNLGHNDFTVPEVIYDRLVGGNRRFYWGHLNATYASVEAAKSALEYACLSYARGLAGLPMWEWEEPL